jgi:hypothetical protein
MRFAHFAKGRPTRKEVGASYRRFGSDIFATRLLGASFYCVPGAEGAQLRLPASASIYNRPHRSVISTETNFQTKAASSKFLISARCPTS